MSDALNFTGERYVPEIGGAIGYEHWHRYALALPLAQGRRVLDAACGEGYGSALLAGVAASVTGVDVDAGAIAHAAARYLPSPKLRYARASVAALPLADRSVDLVVSFETIEHLMAQEAMLAEFRRVLVPGGVLLISSPNKLIYSGEMGAENAYHVRELTGEELRAALEPGFPQQRWYGQRVVAHSMLWSLPTRRDAALDALAIEGDAIAAAAPPAPMYFVVVCGARDATLPELPPLSMLDDAAQSVYADYQRALLAEKTQYWDLVDARKIAAQRHDQLVAAVNEAASARERADALAAALEHERAQASERTRQMPVLEAELAATRAQLAFRDSWRGWARWPLGRARQRLGGGSS